MNPRVVAAFGQGRLCRRWSAVARRGLCDGSGGLFWLLWFDLVEGDGVAECFELALEAAGAVLDGVALALPVGSEVAVWDLVADDVVVGHEQVVADRADRFGLAAPSAELREVRGEVGAFGADGSPSALGQLRGQPAGPGRVRPDRRRPADWWWPGHAPAQDAKCPTVGNTLMSSPHSAIRTCAAWAWTPGIVHSSSIV